MFSHPDYCDTGWVIWVDNCSGQNKCWTLYTMLMRYVNNHLDIDSISLKYLTVGHTFMSADNFHRHIEQEMKKMDKLFDFQDFIKCVSKVGDTIIMKFDDFLDFENGLSQSQASKSTRPLLKDVYIAQFRKGSTSLFFKTHTSGTNSDFMEATFLKRKSEQSILNCEKINSQKMNRGITPSKKQIILDNLSTLMPTNRRSFYENLPVNEESADLISQDDE